MAATMPVIADLIVPPLLRREASINRLKEHVRCPGTCCRTITPVEIQRGSGSLHLLECHTALDQVLNAIANHHEHVAIAGDIGGIRHPPVARYDPRAALRP